MRGAIHVGDTPILRFTFHDQDGAVMDVSSASGAGTKRIFLRKPSGTVLTKTASFTTSGIDGAIQWQTLTTDFDVQGGWEAQAEVIITAGTFRCEEQHFDVIGVIA